MSKLEQQAEKRVMEYLHKKEQEFYKRYVDGDDNINYIMNKLLKLLYKRLSPMNNFLYYLYATFKRIKEDELLYLTQSENNKEIVDVCTQKIEKISNLSNEIFEEITNLNEYMLSANV